MWGGVKKWRTASKSVGWKHSEELTEIIMIAFRWQEMREKLISDHLIYETVRQPFDHSIRQMFFFSISYKSQSVNLLFENIIIILLNGVSLRIQFLHIFMSGALQFFWSTIRNIIRYDRMYCVFINTNVFLFLNKKTICDFFLKSSVSHVIN
jgi:hypothetical protein